MSDHTFVSPSIFLFLDQLIVAMGGWAYWLVISKVATTGEIGEATTVFSLVLLIAALSQLGLEYPLLKRAATDRSGVFGTALVIELMITVASIPIIFYMMDAFYEQAVQEFILIAVAMLILSSLGFVPRYALLGISESKKILLIDLVGIVIRFGIGYSLVILGFGAFGMLISFLVQGLLVTIVTVIISVGKMGISFSGRKYLFDILKEGLVNTPSKISRMLILSLSIVLLASFGISSSQIGIFYIALMVSVVAGGLASSMAYMVIPASSAANKDLSVGSMRISLSLSVPLISILIVAPNVILGIVGEQYVSAQSTLVILSIAVLPSAIVLNAISGLNNVGDSRKLIILGTIEVVTFFIAFTLLVPTYGTEGAAYSILIAFIGSSIPVVYWSEKRAVRYIAFAILSIALATGVGFILSQFLFPAYIAGIISAATAFVLVIILKNISVAELLEIGKSIARRTYAVR